MDQGRPKRETWRSLLGLLTEKPSEKQRVASLLQVRRYTVERWIGGKSEPRPASVRKLPDVFPSHQARLRELIEEEFPGIFSSTSLKKQEEGEIPAIFLTQILHAYCELGDLLAAWTIARMVLLQLEKALDQECLGLRLSLLRLTPPTGDGWVRSLHEIGMTHSPSATIEHTGLTLFGRESLCGEAITTHGMVVSDNEMVVPLSRRKRLAGCLVVERSSPPLTAGQQKLVQGYARCLSLMFFDDHFYDPRSIDLKHFPPPEEQMALLDHFSPPKIPSGLFPPPPEVYQHIEALLLSRK